MGDAMRVLPPMAPKRLVDILEAWMMGYEGQVLLADVLEDCEELNGSHVTVKWMADALRAFGTRTRLCCDGVCLWLREEQEHLRLVVEELLHSDMSLVDMMNQLPVKICLKAVPSAKERLERLKQAVMGSELMALAGSRIYPRMAPEWVPEPAWVPPTTETSFNQPHPPVFVIYGGSDMPYEPHEAYRDEPTKACWDVPLKKPSRKGYWGRLVADTLDGLAPRSLESVLQNELYKHVGSVAQLMRHLQAEPHHGPVVVDELTQTVRLRSFQEQVAAVLESYLRDSHDSELSLATAAKCQMVQPHT